MGENRFQKHRLRNAAVCGGGGGGHIVRSTGRKDRHSKVCTAKGPRDRRVRLSAHTAIQFYDVQDRLGYDRPSKAVDWLINKAKTAIDELAELPAWKPATQNPNYHREIRDGNANFVDSDAGPSGKRTMVTLENNDNQNDVVVSSFLPPSMDSDTIKTFLPMEANSYQDLKLSLQSFQDPIILLHHHPAHHDIFSGAGAGAATHLGFDASEHHEHHQRLAGWNVGIDAGAGGCGEIEGYLFNSPPPPPPFPPPLFGGESQFLSSPRGPLQSSNTPWIRAWTEQSPATAMAAADPSQHHQTTMLPIFPSPLSGIGFPAGVDGFSGFRIPARIQGEEEEHDGISDKLSSASSESCH